MMTEPKAASVLDMEYGAQNIFPALTDMKESLPPLESWTNSVFVHDSLDVRLRQLNWKGHSLSCMSCFLSTQ